VEPPARRSGDPPERRSDAAIATLIAAGDEPAFMEAYDAHVVVLFGVMTRFLGDREAAAEVVQETYLALWQRAASYRADAGSLRTWLLSVARHRALDRLRAEARRPRLVAIADGIDDRSARWSEPTIGGTASVDAQPGPSLERRWTQAVVRAAVAGMPADERSVLVLAYDEDLSQSQIAARLGLPIGTVKSRTRRAMARLRELLAPIPDLRTAAESDDGSR
jgi:RNA polymerase sigma-70 factor (ECF subfamily)